MNLHPVLIRLRRARRAVGPLAAVGLASCVCAASCSADPATLPFAEAARRITGLRSLDRSVTEVTDARAVELFKECLLEAEEVSEPEEGTRASRIINLRLGNKWLTQPRQFVYDDLPPGNPSYLQWGERWYRVPGGFGIMADAVRGYRPDSYAVDPGDEEFLRTYEWTPFFLISTTSVNLPARLIHRPGAFPEVIYWAWNNELSKDIGLDLSPYLGKTVEARLYKTAETLPEPMGPNRGAGRAVVIRSEGKIVGAWLDLGSHYCFACSLKGRALEEVTDKDFDSWVSCLIDPADPLEQTLSKMSPEEIIETYYSAINRKDYALAHACESRRYLISYLAANMDNKRLYNDGFGEESGAGLGNFLSVKVLRITRQESFERAEIDYGDKRCYSVALEQQRRVLAGSSGGYFVTMKQETPDTGWRIYSIGTGP